MIRSSHVAVRVDLSRVRRNAQAILQATGVPLIAVVKADAYGLGARQVSRAIADLVESFYVFDLQEAQAYDLAQTARRTIALLVQAKDADACKALRVQPAVWNEASASALLSARPILSIDTGQQRFGVPVHETSTIDRILAAGRIEEAFTHATTIAQVQAFERAVADRSLKRHAAGSGLLEDQSSHLDAVRPGIALYRGAVNVTSPLVEVHETRGPAGYSGFTARRHGIILAGYSNGLRVGPCRINGRASRILEVGMQSAFVECTEADAVGGDVTLLGDGLDEMAVAQAWQTSPQEALFRLSGLGERTYIGP